MRKARSGGSLPKLAAVRASSRTIELTQEELDAIYVRTPDPVRRNVRSTPVKVSADPDNERRKTRSDMPADKRKKPDGEEYLLVDGYNIIFAWDELRELSEIDLAAARGKPCGYPVQLSGIPEMYVDPCVRRL